MSTKQSAIEAAAEAIGSYLYPVSEGYPAYAEMVHEATDILHSSARAAILAYLSALAEDEASVEAVARGMCVAKGMNPDEPYQTYVLGGWHGEKPAWMHLQLEAKGALSALLSRAKEQKP